MRKVVGVDTLGPQPGGAAITVGTFDGVHLGHRALVARTIDEARSFGATSVLVTWDRHPLETLRPGTEPKVLTTPERKAELIEDTGIDTLVVLPFDHAFSKWSPERFVTDVLVRLGARAVIVGDGWRFGHKAAGTTELLQKMGAEHGFHVQVLTLAAVEGESVSSTRVRSAIAQGDMISARTLLARPFDVDGIVLRGERRGTELGFPTANLKLDRSIAHPPRGVYAGRAVTEAGIAYTAAINVGVNPQFGGDPATTPWRVEAYLLDFDGDLYDQRLRVELHERLRDELKFESVAALVEQMAKDVDRTRDLMT
ncbi:MAG: bifunctional riboflavin kinase/FAD synthetase [Actinobacteria bacterium]|nr:bifunctional riboflavin kinase/FAD synthetase [Actinomycetota bacterium]